MKKLIRKTGTAIHKAEQRFWNNRPLVLAVGITTALIGLAGTIFGCAIAVNAAKHLGAVI